MHWKQRSIRYLVHLLLIILFIFTMDQLIHKLVLESWELNAWLYYGSRKVTGIAFGVLLALEYLHHERERPGSWKINPHRLLILGVPALVFSFQQSIFQYPISNTYVTIFEVMFGYILGTSVYKKD